MEDAAKKCSKCGEWKAVKDFNRNNHNRKDGLEYHCRECSRARGKARYVLYPEMYSSKRAAYRERKRELNYGVSREKLRELFDKQGGKCLVCSAELDFHKAHVDHSHGTNKVRGFLCGGCNLAIGHLGDDPKRARLLAAYLQAFQTDHPDPHQLLLNLRSIGGF